MTSFEASRTQSAAADAAQRLAEFRELRGRGALCTAVTEQMAGDAAEQFLERALGCGEYLRDAITLVTEIATLEEPCLSEPGRRATFPNLIERLSDSFDPAACLLYDRVFAQMIGICRALPQGRALDTGLRDCGLQTEADLLQRKERLRRRPAWRERPEHEAVRKVLVLSRVTLGADVTVSSVVLQKAQQVFPAAERVLLGSSKLGELFGGDPTLRVRAVAYPSGGTLLERLTNWLSISAAVGNEISSLTPPEYVLLDPDSRMLQLGMLPAPGEESRYFFFESRAWGGTGDGRTLSELARDWLNEMLGGSGAVSPRVWLREEDLQAGREAARRLRAGSPFLTAISFGAGGNNAKRRADPFEEQLIRGLLNQGGSVLLDKGAGDEELERANRLVEKLRATGRPALELNAVSIPHLLSGDSGVGRRLATWEGGIGGWSGLVASSDAFIGYDSASQHIAAALGTPVIVIFTADAPSVFRQRWRPTGHAPVRIISEETAGAGQPASAASTERLVRETLRLHNEICSRGETRSPF